jgi:hypothetical protein
MSNDVPTKFAEFLADCDRGAADPFTRMRLRMHERVDEIVDPLENKYRTGREGKSWADLAHDVYNDSKNGWDQLTKEAADWYYANPR